MAAMKTLSVVLLTLFIVSTMVSSKDDELLEAAYAIVQPSPAVPVKAPLAPSVGVKVTPPPPAPAPPVKPPVLAPPVKPPAAPQPPPPRNTKECYPPCVVRCKLHSRKNKIAAVFAIWFVLATYMVAAQVEAPASPPTSHASSTGLESIFIGLAGVAISSLLLKTVS
ncbi:hypothetical protein POM88_004087 [Heracleum sosnowskyi]|uniref:Uncharacterized protein n=1 Tax=Heracleum sosnowskyi TaxID=360622 RepID=A0AAD8JHC3_9APIA|nr:hypothetical protein POM88_004087 [Heracleum sosnowskyi]